MANRIQVDLVADLKLALDKLGMGKDIEKALKSHKSVVEGIAKSLGLDIGKALAAGIDSGMSDVSRKIQDKVSRVHGLFGAKLDYKDFINKSLGPQRPSVNQGYVDNTAAMLKKVSDVSRTGGAPFDIQSFINKTIGPQSVSGASAPLFRRMAELARPSPIDDAIKNESFEKDLAKIRTSGAAAQAKLSRLFGQQSAETPPIPSGFFAKIEQRLFGGHGGSGGLLGGFGRYEIGRAFMSSVGLGGGVGGRLGGAALAGAGSKVPGLTVGLAALTVAIDSTKLAFEHLIEAAQQGAKLYEQSRALGISTIQASSFLKSLSAVGISEQQALTLAAYGEFGRGGKGGGGIRGNIAGEMVAAGTRGGMSALEIQQIRNMSQEINYAWGKTREAAEESANSARANFSIVTEWTIAGEKLKVTFQELSAILEPVFYGLAESFGALLDEVNRDLEYWRALLQQAGLGGPRETTTPTKLTPYVKDTHITSLEKMGLVIGRGGDTTKAYLAKIADNTKDTVAALLARGSATPGIPMTGVGKGEPQGESPSGHIFGFLPELLAGIAKGLPNSPMNASTPSVVGGKYHTPDIMTKDIRPWAHGAPFPSSNPPATSTAKLESVFDRFIAKMEQAATQQRRNDVYGPAMINFP